MRLSLVYLVALCAFVSCNSIPETGSTESKLEMITGNTDKEPDDQKPMVLTIEGGLDGPEQCFYTYKDGLESSEDMADYTEVHIIPFGKGNDVSEEMIGLAESHFKLNRPYDKLTATVKVFYTRDKKVEMVSYSLLNGVPNGECTIKDPKGKSFISREYEKGEFKKSLLSPFGTDWTFDQRMGKLLISDVKFSLKRLPVGDLVVSLMTSMHEESSEDNNLYTIMQKNSFKQPISVNGELLTGKLLAYFHPKSLREDLYYELNFTDGILDGEVRINNDWGELELHEVFNMGVLDTTVYKINYDEMDGLAKPIIYLYPEKEQRVEVRINLDGKLSHTYPEYNKGWEVTASPDGTLRDGNGKEYYALYWEGQNNKEFRVEEGTVVKGSESIIFLERALETLGLTRREANEFIIYWLPELEKNPYNLIHFSTSEYEEMAQLEIIPEPETLIRVMMVFQSLTKPTIIKEQNLDMLKKERRGFTVVEWGGSRIQDKSDIL